MNDDVRAPVGKPMNDEGEEIESEDAEEIDERISDDPVVEENGATYDPAAQAPPEAER